jgi:hypothetical protein
MLAPLWRRCLLAIATVVLVVVLWDVATYDRVAWLEDYQRLKTETAQGYANLDWLVGHRGLDLPALDRATTGALVRAHSRVRAYLALRRLARAFRDPHYRMTWRLKGGSPDDDDDDDAPAGRDCEAAGYREGRHDFRFPFARMSRWRPLRGGDFYTGQLGGTGVLRIAQFGENQYLAACRQVFRPGMGRRALAIAVRRWLDASLTGALQELRALGIRRLLVDVTGNGGGTEWEAQVTAALTDRRMTRARTRRAAPTCDRGEIWHGRPVCPVLEPPGGRIELQGSGRWTGPVLILADRGTASASESFIAWLKQNGVARVLGERTAGAGCGYLDGGGRVRLRVAPLEVLMPNCARFLDDGTNEIEGLSPDVAIPMHLDDPDRQAAALEAALARV